MGGLAAFLCLLCGSYSAMPVPEDGLGSVGVSALSVWISGLYTHYKIGWHHLVGVAQPRSCAVVCLMYPVRWHVDMDVQKDCITPCVE